MKFPCLVPKEARSTKVIVRLSVDDLNDDGELLESEPVEYMGNVQLNSYDVLTSDKRKITLSGKVLIAGDIAPDKPLISSGSCSFNGGDFGIYKGQKNYNPDGTVNYTTLELK